MHQIALGDVTVTRVWEYFGPVDMTTKMFFPGASDEVWKENADLLDHHFVDPESRVVNSGIQTWVLRSGGRTILVDTGVGNHKERPYSPVWSHRETNYLDNLARAGVAPEDVDIVINTHLHVDHVGWNTFLDGREWVPTFPNAKYLMPKRDFDFWNPANNNQAVLGRGNQNVFEDSVAPVYDAGLVHLWEDGYDLDSHLRLESAPGHTPGSSILTLASGTDRAVFVGDMIHSPVQILDPETNSCFCEDPVQARQTRRRVLGWAADNNALVFPAHLGGHGATEVSKQGEGFAIAGWAPFSPYAKEA